MTFNGWLQIALFCVIVIAAGEAAWRLHDARLRRASAPSSRRCCGPVEGGLYWLCGVDEKQEQNWLGLRHRMLMFSLASFVVLYLPALPGPAAV